MADHIPVTFEKDGKEFHGVLSKVAGAGNTVTWHLMVNNFYHGQLVNTQNGWQFGDQQGQHPELAELFGYCVAAWHDCH